MFKPVRKLGGNSTAMQVKQLRVGRIPEHVGAAVSEPKLHLRAENACRVEGSGLRLLGSGFIV
jgi:hypothetical protein